MIINSFLIFVVNIIYEKILNFFFNKKNARNFVAGTHALSCVLLNGIYFVTRNDYICELSYCVTFGYFLYDLMYIFLYEGINLLRGLFVYHHLSSIYLLLNNDLFYNTNLLFFLGELSNLPNYIIYHYLHEKNLSENKKEILKVSKIIQKFLYTTIRIFVMSYLSFEMYNNLNFSDWETLKLSIIIAPIYFMGIIWTIAMLLQ